MLQAKKFLGFVKRFSEFEKGIYETGNCHLHYSCCFSILHFILFLHVASNN